MKKYFFLISPCYSKKNFFPSTILLSIYVKEKIQKERVFKKKMNKDKLKKILEAQDYNLKEYQKFISIKIDTSKDLNQTKQSLSFFY